MHQFKSLFRDSSIDCWIYPEVEIYLDYHSAHPMELITRRSYFHHSQCLGASSMIYLKPWPMHRKVGLMMLQVVEGISSHVVVATNPMGQNRARAHSTLSQSFKQDFQQMSIN